MENLEITGNLTAVREMLGNLTMAGEWSPWIMCSV